MQSKLEGLLMVVLCEQTKVGSHRSNHIIEIHYFRNGHRSIRTENRTCQPGRNQHNDDCYAAAMLVRKKTKHK